MDRHKASALDVDDATIETVIGVLEPHIRTACKAPVIALMSGIAVGIFSGALGKALLVGIVCLVVSLFATWRRFLEPISFWVFVAAIIYWCDARLIDRIATVTSHALS
ncbi:hypothetical protein AB7813_08855 [Tardiphaga sp. 20_F10_N6_6]|uniref:hypothetical protein n=1 Tax=Tardiphaga sp. 20_F10_N6_6 TaxID=3240788 RepID=UPI003F8B0F26